MSTTITQTEQRTILKESVFEKRSTFIRTTSIEKLKKFNNFVCSQHYYLIPGILLWLKQSQSLLRTQMEKCIMYLKTVSLLCVLKQLINEKSTNKNYSLMLKNTLNCNLTSLKFKLTNTYIELKYYLLKSLVYMGLFLIAMNTIGCVGFIVLNLPPLGFFFLIGCLAVMARIKFKILDKIEEKAEKDKNIQSIVFGKTISKVKLF